MTWISLKYTFYQIIKWMILSKNLIKRLNSLFELPYLFSVTEGFTLLLHCSLSKSPFESSVLRLYPGYLRILRVTYPLLIALIDRKGSHWVLSMLLFIRKLWPYPIQWEWENIEATQEFWVFPFITHWDRAYLRLISFIEKILPSSRLS